MNQPLLIAVAALAVASPAFAQDSRDVEARDLFVAGKYPEALSLYSKLYGSTHHPTYLRNLGRCHQMMRQPDPAIVHFRAYLRDAKDLGAQERTEIEGYIREMQALRATQPSAQAPPPALAPPSVSTAPAYVAPSVSDAPAADTAPITRKWWFWGGLGAVVAGGVITAIVLSSGKGDRLPCPPNTICPP
jgi:hypothetical protein